MEGKKRKWMKAAVPESHKGLFTKKADAAGKSVHEYAEEEKHAGGTLGKEANLALTFENEAHKQQIIRQIEKCEVGIIHQPILSIGLKYFIVKSTLYLPK